MIPVHTDEELQNLLRSKRAVVVHCRVSPVGAAETSLTQDILDEENPDASLALCSVVIAEVPCMMQYASEIPGPTNIGTSDAFVFFRDGVPLYALDGSAGSGQFHQSLMLLLKNPDTLRRMAHQENANASAPKQLASASSTVEQPALRLFVAGDRSSVGKSSTCIGILGSLLQLGYKPSELAYIKPATQCESPQLVSQWCEQVGIACQGIGPIVFYSGFTREFLKGTVGTSHDLLGAVQHAVERLAQNRKVVLLDGVGYPAVGSICGVSNADVALAAGAPVVLVGKSGVGDAVDSYNLNACFFEARRVPVLGGIFNRLSTKGFYSLDKCKEAVTMYFQRTKPQNMPYGFVPEVQQLQNPSAPPPASPPSHSSSSQGASSDTKAPPRVAIDTVGDQDALNAQLKAAGADSLVLGEYGALWCSNCQRIKPQVAELAGELQAQVKVLNVDVDDSPELADAADVGQLPCFVLYRAGQEVGRYVGSELSQLRALLSEHINHHASATPPQPPTETAQTPQVDLAAAALEAAGKFIEAFRQHVDVQRLIQDAGRQQGPWSDGPSGSSLPQAAAHDLSVQAAGPVKDRKLIEAEAAAMGAHGGCQRIKAGTT